MKNCLLIFAVFTFACSAFAQNFSGKIGKFEIVMELVKDGKAVSGTYFYKNQGLNIPLDGTMSENTLVINERNPKNQKKAVFLLKPNGSKSFAGTWEDVKTGKMHSVQLTEIQQNVPQIPKNITGKFITEDMQKCRITVDIFREDNNYTYKIKTPFYSKTGRLLFSRDLDEQYIYMRFMGLAYAENKGPLDEDGNGLFDNSGPGEIEGFVESSEKFIIQNGGNSMNYYVKFKGCDEKYIHFTKIK